MWGDGQITKERRCPDWWCGKGQDAKSLKKFKHGADCSISLLAKLGDTKKLRDMLCGRASLLDYEGGGFASCSICKGLTTFRGNNPRHRKWCPGKLF